MQFKPDTYFYLHNIGIDYQPIFFSERNKAYFQKKAYKLIQPYASIISIILADNQFHILIKTHENYKGMALNHNIGILLRSYTRAINKERFRVGSLFRRHTKAFSKISDIPKGLRKFILPFIQYFKKGQLADFGKTIDRFIQYLLGYRNKKDRASVIQSKLSYQSIFEHPLKEQKDQLII